MRTFAGFRDDGILGRWKKDGCVLWPAAKRRKSPQWYPHWSERGRQARFRHGWCRCTASFLHPKAEKVASHACALSEQLTWV